MHVRELKLLPLSRSTSGWSGVEIGAVERRLHQQICLYEMLRLICAMLADTLIIFRARRLSYAVCEDASECGEAHLWLEVNERFHS